MRRFAATATTTLPGSTTGAVSLEVTVDYSGLELTVTESASVELDGTCTAPTTSTSSTLAPTTTAAPASQPTAVGVTPRFTG
jgi:hypothetical protein